MNCWELHKCGREAGGKNVRESGVCPAYPENGNIWEGIMPGSCVCSLAENNPVSSAECLKCAYYNSVYYADEFSREEYKKLMGLFGME